jgi:hypothetical protein
MKCHAKCTSGLPLPRLFPEFFPYRYPDERFSELIGYLNLPAAFDDFAYVLLIPKEFICLESIHHKKSEK